MIMVRRLGLAGGVGTGQMKRIKKTKKNCRATHLKMKKNDEDNRMIYTKKTCSNIKIER